MAGIRVIADTDASPEVDKVVYNQEGKIFAFYVSPKGTIEADAIITPTGNIDTTDLIARIEAMQGIRIEQNPDWDDVKTDTDDDGINDTGDYNWVDNGFLYTAYLTA